MNKSNYRGTIFMIAVVLIVLVAGFVLSGVLSREPADGVPPNPHGEGEYLESECNACHLTGVRGAPLFDHPERENCLDCHT